MEGASTGLGVRAQSGPEILPDEKGADGGGVSGMAGGKRFIAGVTDCPPAPNGARPLLGSEKRLGANAFNIKEWFGIDLSAANPKVIY
jgi:hypothetical protein